MGRMIEVTRNETVYDMVL